MEIGGFVLDCASNRDKQTFAWESSGPDPHAQCTTPSIQTLLFPSSAIALTDANGRQASASKNFMLHFLHHQSEQEDQAAQRSNSGYVTRHGIGNKSTATSKASDVINDCSTAAVTMQNRNVSLLKADDHGFTANVADKPSGSLCDAEPILDDSLVPRDKRIGEMIAQLVIRHCQDRSETLRAEVHQT